MPYPADTFHTVVFTFVLCSVDDPGRALAEARRVLKPEGKLVVLEHVRGDGRLARWQDRLAPVWKRIGAGCRPNRDTRTAIELAGFTFDRVETFDPLPRLVLIRPLLQVVASTAEPTTRPGSSPPR